MHTAPETVLVKYTGARHTRVHQLRSVLIGNKIQLSMQTLCNKGDHSVRWELATQDEYDTYPCEDCDAERRCAAMALIPHPERIMPDNPYYTTTVVYLRSSHWVRLPGTDIEIYLCGKHNQMQLKRKLSAPWNVQHLIDTSSAFFRVNPRK